MEPVFAPRSWRLQKRDKKVGRRESYCYPNHPCFPFHDLSDPLQDAREQKSGSARSPPGSPCSKSILRRSLAKQEGKIGEIFWRLFHLLPQASEDEGRGNRKLCHASHVTPPRGPEYCSTSTHQCPRADQRRALDIAFVANM
jgi:hypothetical protein